LSSYGFELTDNVRSELENKFGLAPGATHLIGLVAGTVIDVAADIARDYDEKEGYDQNLAGLLCSGRTRNLVATQLRSEDLDEVLEIHVQGSGLSTLLRGGGTEVHPYSCGTGDVPLLAGSTTKKRVLKEGSEQLALFSAGGEVFKPLHIVVAYTRDLEGVVSTRVGVMSGPEEFAWELQIYERPSESTNAFAADTNVGRAAEQPSHDRQPVEEPAVRLRRGRDERGNS
jgi:hypothetical protein